MKKVLKLLVAIILAIVILSTFMFLIDCSRGKSEKEPIFALLKTYDNGGNTYYRGVGYTISYGFTGEIKAKALGTLEIELKEGNKNIEEPDFNGDNTDENKVIIESGDSENNIISGDAEIPSGEILSGDVINNIEFSGEEIKDYDTSSGEVISGDKINEDEKEYSFIATIIGINNNNLVVQALENEAVTASSDMFSFSTNEDTKKYLIGQKVKIKYTGEIRESYPAQIDVIGIEIVE